MPVSKRPKSGPKSTTKKKPTKPKAVTKASLAAAHSLIALHETQQATKTPRIVGTPRRRLNTSRKQVTFDEEEQQDELGEDEEEDTVFPEPEASQVSQAASQPLSTLNHRCSFDCRVFLDGVRVAGKPLVVDLLAEDHYDWASWRAYGESSIEKWMVEKGYTGTKRIPAKVTCWYGGMNHPRLAEITYRETREWKQFEDILIERKHNGKTAEIELYYGLATNPNDQDTTNGPNRGLVGKRKLEKERVVPKGVNMLSQQDSTFPSHLFGDRPVVTKGSSTDKMLTDLSIEISTEPVASQVVRKIKTTWNCSYERCSNFRFCCWVRDNPFEHYKVSDEEVENWARWLLDPAQIHAIVGNISTSLRHKFTVLGESKQKIQAVGGKRANPKSQEVMPILVASPTPTNIVHQAPPPLQLNLQQL